MFTLKSVSGSEVADSDYASKYKKYGRKHLYAIMDRDEVVAYAAFKMKMDKVLWLDVIEVIRKESGTGTKIVHFFFQYFSLEKIEGLIMCEERAYRFWERLGAEIYYIDEEGYAIDELIDAELESPFTLSAVKLEPETR
jgi:hypothetical protein